MYSLADRFFILYIGYVTLVMALWCVGYMGAHLTGLLMISLQNDFPQLKYALLSSLGLLALLQWE